MVEFNNYLYNLRNIIDKHWLPALIENDEDRLVVIEGKEGSSKSTLALHLAHYFMLKQNKEFKTFNIHYSVKSFVNAVNNSKGGEVQLIDEGALLGFSRDVMSRDTRWLVKVLTTCRSKNNLILICVPNIKLLDKYIREHRLHAVLKVTIRGRCDVYHISTWKKSHYKEKYSKTMKLKRSSMIDHYPKFEKLWDMKGWKDYLDHKHSQLTEEGPKILNEQEIKDKMLLSMYKNGMTYQDIGKAMNMPWPTVRNAIYRAK